MAADSGVGRVFGGRSQPLEPFFISGSSSSFLGSSSMVRFEDACLGKRSERSFFRTFDQEEIGDDDFNEYFHQPEKKRRLTVEQVKFLEKSFEAENKLEPHRKIELAKDLGLQPRQVAIWFQNRRARWKTKQLEKDFDTLQASYYSLMADYDNLLEEEKKLRAEVVHLTDKLHLKEKTQEGHFESSNTHNQSKTTQKDPIIDFARKQKDTSSAKSNAFDSDSPCNIDGGHSDISQEDEDYLIKSLLPSSHVFPKIEDIDYHELGQDHASLFWPYWDVNLKM